MFLKKKQIVQTDDGSDDILQQIKDKIADNDNKGSSDFAKDTSNLDEVENGSHHDNEDDDILNMLLGDDVDEDKDDSENTLTSNNGDYVDEDIEDGSNKDDGIDTDGYMDDEDNIDDVFDESPDYSDNNSGEKRGLVDDLLENFSQSIGNVGDEDNKKEVDDGVNDTVEESDIGFYDVDDDEEEDMVDMNATTELVSGYSGKESGGNNSHDDIGVLQRVKKRVKKNVDDNNDSVVDAQDDDVDLKEDNLNEDIEYGVNTTEKNNDVKSAVDVSDLRTTSMQSNRNLKDDASNNLNVVSISNETKKSVKKNISDLIENVKRQVIEDKERAINRINGSKTIEQVAVDLMRPVIVDYLDGNLERIVSDIVKDEIKRIIDDIDK